MIKTIKDTLNELSPLSATASFLCMLSLPPHDQKRASFTNIIGTAAIILNSLDLVAKATLLPTFHEKKIYHPQNLAIASIVAGFIASCNYAYFFSSCR